MDATEFIPRWRGWGWGYKRKKSMKKLIAVVFVAAIVTIVLVVIMNAVAALSPGNPKTGSYDGIWVGNASYGGEICGVVEFNVSENEVRDFIVNYTNISFDMIDWRGVKVTSGNGSTRVKISESVTIESHENGEIVEYPGSLATIVNNQFNYSEVFFNYTYANTSILGVFTSNNNACGTFKHECLASLPGETYPNVLVFPLTTWNATKKIPTPEEKKEPGFEIIFAIAGILAVAYLLRKRG